MIYTVIVPPEVKLEIEKQARYYDSKTNHLGSEFLEVVNIHLKYLSKSPHFQIRYNEIRCLPTNKFPFLIHYIILEKAKTVLILGVIHTSKNPAKWPGK